MKIFPKFQETAERTLIAVNLRQCTLSELRDHFSKYGKLQSCAVYNDGTSKKHAKIQFESFNQAKAAFKNGSIEGNSSKHNIGSDSIFLRSNSGRLRYEVMYIIFFVCSDRVYPSPHLFSDLSSVALTNNRQGTKL